MRENSEIKENTASAAASEGNALQNEAAGYLSSGKFNSSVLLGNRNLSSADDHGLGIPRLDTPDKDWFHCPATDKLDQGLKADSPAKLQAEKQIEDAIIKGDSAALVQTLSQFSNNTGELKELVDAVETNLSNNRIRLSISLQDSKVVAVSTDGNNHSEVVFDTTNKSVNVVDLVLQMDGSFRPYKDPFPNAEKTQL